MERICYPQLGVDHHSFRAYTDRVKNFASSRSDRIALETALQDLAVEREHHKQNGVLAMNDEEIVSLFPVSLYRTHGSR